MLKIKSLKRKSNDRPSGSLISPNVLKRTINYKFTTGKYSHLDNFFDPFYTSCAALIPDIVSPNLISLFGALLLQFTLWRLMRDDPSFDSPPSLYLSLFVGFAVFFYQILDAVDGKHARRTGKTSVLGALVDHGLDVFATPTVSIIAMKIVAPEPNVLSFLTFVFIPQTTHFLLLAREHLNGKFEWHVAGGMGGATEFLTLVSVISFCNVRSPFILVTPLHKLYFPFSLYELAAVYMILMEVFVVMPSIFKLALTKPILPERSRKDAVQAICCFICVELFQAAAFYSTVCNVKDRHWFAAKYLIMLPFGHLMFRMLLSSAARVPLEYPLHDQIPSMILIVALTIARDHLLSVRWLSLAAAGWLAARQIYLLVMSYNFVSDALEEANTNLKQDDVASED